MVLVYKNGRFAIYKVFLKLNKANELDFSDILIELSFQIFVDNKASRYGFYKHTNWAKYDGGMLIHKKV